MYIIMTNNKTLTCMRVFLYFKAGIMKIGSDILLEMLHENWVTRIFGYPWWAIMPLYDKIELFDWIEHILVRNEQWAAFAAQGVSRSSKKSLWVAIATSWPGATNLITWIMDAYMDSIPTLFITGQVAYSLMWKDVFQEVDIIGATMSCVKHSFVITDVQDIPNIVNEAINIATTWRPWPVLIDFPKDISLMEYKSWEKNIPLNLHYNRQPILEVTRTDINHFLKMLDWSQKPILLLGQWIKSAEASSNITQIVETLWIPCVTTLLAKWVISEKSKNYLWMLGMHWFYHANLAMHNADLIINIWSHFDDRIVWNYTDFAKNARVIHIDIDTSEKNKVVQTDLFIHADAKEFCKKWQKIQLHRLDIENWRKEIDTYKETHPYIHKTYHFSTKNALNCINSATEKDKDIENYMFVTDVWQHQMWAAQILKVASPEAWMSSWWSGTMWFALPTAIWAAFENPEKMIIIIVGDWGIQMNIQELQVLKDHDLNIKVVIMNNNFLWMVRQWQELFFDKNYASTPITSPDYIKLADAYWITWLAAESEKELDEILIKQFVSPWPAIIEVRNIADEDNIFPMVAPGKTLWDTMWEE